MASLALSLGGLELGILTSSVLYGIVTVQVYLYTSREFDDPLWLRLMVWTVCIRALETAHTVISWYLLYSLTVINYGQPYKIEEKTWTYLAGFPLAACIGSIVQAYFVYRVRVLSKKLFIPVIAWGAVLLRCGFGVAIAVVAMSPHPHLASTLTRKVVDRLVRYTVETGLITSLCAAGVLACVSVLFILFRGLPVLKHVILRSFLCLIPLHLAVLHFSIFTVYPKLFSNSLLTSLNARHSLRKTFSGPVLTLNSDVENSSIDVSNRPVSSSSLKAEDVTI
ncbi:hypothetical protein K439DRAFT_1616755 [Ramaria rubella]|nr:hypothetical protein K439DRAFT_1616755 [Ramaria rubella]